MAPGDKQGWASAFGGGAAVPLPRKPVPDLFTSRVRRVITTAIAEAGLPSRAAGKAEGCRGEVVWTTNPSRMSLFGPNHEIVLFRDDTHARLRRSAVQIRGARKRSAEGAGGGERDVTMSGANPGADAGADADHHGRHGDDPGSAIDIMELDAAAPGREPAGSSQVPVVGPGPPQAAADGANELPSTTRAARKLVKTLLDQGHLAPFPPGIRPVHWDWASVMHLCPLPTAAVLVDTSAPPYCVTYEGCHVMNPSSVLVRGRKAVARWVEYELGGVGQVRECTV